MMAKAKIDLAIIKAPNLDTLLWGKKNMLWVILLEKKNYLCKKRDGIRWFDGTYKKNHSSKISRCSQLKKDLRQWDKQIRIQIRVTVGML